MRAERLRHRCQASGNCVGAKQDLILQFLTALSTRHSRLALRSLASCMAASLVFGVYYHYMAVPPDNVWHLPAGNAQERFRVTALLLAATETSGLAVGIAGLREERA